MVGVPSINYQDAGRFTLSLGVILLALAVIAGFEYNYLYENYGALLAITTPFILMISGMNLFSNGLKHMVEGNKFETALKLQKIIIKKQEITLNEIRIKQEIKGLNKADKKIIQKTIDDVHSFIENVVEGSKKVKKK